MLYLGIDGAPRDIGKLFPRFTLEPEPMLAERGELVGDGLGPDEELDFGWCLPLYPEVTASDIKKAASRIAERLAQIYKDRSLESRIEYLSSTGGLGPKAIADRLGVSESTVDDHLAKLR